MPANPVCGLDVPASRQPGQVDPEHPGGALSSARPQPPDTCGELSFEGFDELRIAVTAMMTRVRQVTTGRAPLADLEQAVHEELLAVGAAADGRGWGVVETSGRGSGVGRCPTRYRRGARTAP